LNQVEQIAQSGVEVWNADGRRAAAAQSSTAYYENLGRPIANVGANSNAVRRI